MMDRENFKLDMELCVKSIEISRFDDIGKIQIYLQIIDGAIGRLICNSLLKILEPIMKSIDISNNDNRYPNVENIKKCPILFLKGKKLRVNGPKSIIFSEPPFLIPSIFRTDKNGNQSTETRIFQGNVSFSSSSPSPQSNEIMTQKQEGNCNDKEKLLNLLMTGILASEDNDMLLIRSDDQLSLQSGLIWFYSISYFSNLEILKFANDIKTDLFESEKYTEFFGIVFRGPNIIVFMIGESKPSNSKWKKLDRFEWSSEVELENYIVKSILGFKFIRSSQSTN